MTAIIPVAVPPDLGPVASILREAGKRMPLQWVQEREVANRFYKDSIWFRTDTNCSHEEIETDHSQIVNPILAKTSTIAIRLPGADHWYDWLRNDAYATVQSQLITHCAWIYNPMADFVLATNESFLGSAPCFSERTPPAVAPVSRSSRTVARTGRCVSRSSPPSAASRICATAGKLERLLRSGARFADKAIVVRAVADGEATTGAALRIGPLWCSNGCGKRRDYCDTPLRRSEADKTSACPCSHLKVSRWPVSGLIRKVLSGLAPAIWSIRSRTLYMSLSDLISTMGSSVV